MRQLLIVSLLLGGSMLLAPAAASASPAFDPSASLPDIGDSAGALISPEQERRLGQEFLQAIRQQVNIVDDPEIEDYIQNLGQRLVSYVSNRTHDYTFFVIENAAINAFAAPGGVVGVNSGLLLATESENELAAVLAHEVAHVSQRHLTRGFEKLERLNLTTLATVIAAIIISSQDPEAGVAAMTAGVAGNIQSQLNFTRANEQEADRVGIQLLSEAGYDPRSMPLFFERLEQASKYQSSAVPELLRTHPITQNRISDSLNRADQYPRGQYQEGNQFYLVRAKLRVLTTDDLPKLTQQFQQAIDSGQYFSERAARYGYAYALLRSADYAEARKQTERLIAQDQERIAYTDLLAQAEFGLGNADSALRLYQKALELHPNNRQLITGYAQTLLQAAQPAKALDVLSGYLRSRPPGAGLLKLKAQAEDALGATASSHATLAEYYYLKGQLHPAIDHLNIALRQGGLDAHQKSRLEARLRALKEEVLNRQAAAERLGKLSGDLN